MNKANSNSEQLLHFAVREAFKRDILCLALPNEHMLVDHALTLLDDMAMTRPCALDCEGLTEALTCDLEQLGLEYVVTESACNVGVGGILKLVNPDALLRVAPYLIRLEPVLHVFQGRLDKPSYRRGRDGEVVECA